MIFFGSHITGEYVFVSRDMSNVCVGASFSINQMFIFAIGKLFKMKTICYWMGTDVLKYNTVFHYRWRFKLFEMFIDEHLAQAPWLKDELAGKLKKPVKVVTVKPTWIHYDNHLLSSKQPT